MERKRKALELKLASLKEEGDDMPASRNSMIASNEVADESGIFESARGFLDKPPFEPRRDGFIIRTRSDALETKLNSIDILNAIRRIETKLNRIEWIAAIAAAVSIGLAIKLLM